MDSNQTNYLWINGEKENKEERSQGLMGYELHKKEERQRECIRNGKKGKQQENGL